MVNFATKDHIKYYQSEENLKTKERFYKTVLFGVFETYFSIVLKKYDVSKHITDDLKQELHIHIFKNLDKIARAKDSNAFLIQISKNYTLNYLRCLTTNFIHQKSGGNLELTNYQ